MKSPSGWAELGGTVATAAGGRLASGAEKVGEQTKLGSPAHHTMKWLVTTKMGMYSLVLLLILALVVYLFYINPT